MQSKSKPEPGDLRERALRLLARREHSRVELVRKLEHAGFADQDIGPLLDEFEEKNWLSDRRFAESYVADHRARAGNVKLAYDLRQRGVSENTIQTVLDQNAGSEVDRAQDVWQRKFGSLPADPHEQIRQLRFMKSRGFSQAVIHQVFKTANTAD